MIFFKVDSKLLATAILMEGWVLLHEERNTISRVGHAHHLFTFAHTVLERDEIKLNSIGIGALALLILGNWRD